MTDLEYRMAILSGNWSQAGRADKRFNDNHDDKGQFSSGEGSGGGGGSAKEPPSASASAKEHEAYYNHLVSPEGHKEFFKDRYEEKVGTGGTGDRDTVTLVPSHTSAMGEIDHGVSIHNSNRGTTYYKEKDLPKVHEALGRAIASFSADKTKYEAARHAARQNLSAAWDREHK